MKTLDTIISKAREEWPPIFAATEIDRLSGGALRRRTIANLRCKGEIPENIFLKDGRKLLCLRDELLTWWSRRLRPTCGEEVEHV
jgi:hypothetical protein